MTIASISSNTTQNIQLAPPRTQVAAQPTPDTDTQAATGTVAAAALPIQQNPDTARVAAQLQQQLTATQVATLHQTGAQNVATTTAAAPTTVVAAKQTNQTQAATTQAAQQARQQATLKTQAQQTQQQQQATQQAQQTTLQAQTARQPNPPPVTAVQQYQANQNLLQPAGANTHAVTTQA